MHWRLARSPTLCIVGTGTRASSTARPVPSCIGGTLLLWRSFLFCMTMAATTGWLYECRRDCPHRRAGTDVTVELVLVPGDLRPGEGAYLQPRMAVRRARRKTAGTRRFPNPGRGRRKHHSGAQSAWGTAGLL